MTIATIQPDIADTQRDAEGLHEDIVRAVQDAIQAGVVRTHRGVVGLDVYREGGALKTRDEYGPTLNPQTFSVELSIPAEMDEMVEDRNGDWMSVHATIKSLRVVRGQLVADIKVEAGK
jgi:hypothetical protein